jgi:MoaA/NifB/PqqE/SkfB family radical SAM enzyme
MKALARLHALAKRTCASLGEQLSEHPLAAPIRRWAEKGILVKPRLRKRRCGPDPSAGSSVSDTEAYLQSHFCLEPFRTLETSPLGLAYVCCPSWLPKPIGDLYTNPETLWTGQEAQAIRASIIDGSFKYCSRIHCSRITNRSLPRRDAPEVRAIVNEYATAPAPELYPRNVILSHDRSCNLSCPSCRPKLIVAGKAKQAELDSLIETTILPLLRRAETVKITGSGDPFGSNHFRRLIKRLNKQDFPRLVIDLHTNGQLWDERAWNELNLKGRVGAAHISIDAADPGIYAIVRRGGDFGRLLKNLAFVRALRQSGEIRHLTFSMVVQAMNFRQMPAFVRLGQEYAADHIVFEMIRKPLAFTKEEYEKVFIGSPAHPEHAELLDVLRAPELSLPSVEAGNILAHAGISKRELQSKPLYPEFAG